jgi:hypothetical protein
MRHCPALAEARGTLPLLTITGREGTLREGKLKWVNPEFVQRPAAWSATCFVGFGDGFVGRSGGYG